MFQAKISTCVFEFESSPRPIGADYTSPDIQYQEHTKLLISEKSALYNVKR